MAALLPVDLWVASDVLRVPWAHHLIPGQGESEQSLHGVQAKAMILNWSLGSQTDFEGSLYGQGTVSCLTWESQSRGLSYSAMKIHKF